MYLFRVFFFISAVFNVIIDAVVDCFQILKHLLSYFKRIECSVNLSVKFFFFFFQIV